MRNDDSVDILASLTDPAKDGACRLRTSAATLKTTDTRELSGHRAEACRQAAARA